MNFGNVGFVDVIVLALILFPIAVAVFQWLWNNTMPDVFGLKRITYWQALRLLIIAAFLFSMGSSGVTTTI